MLHFINEGMGFYHLLFLSPNYLSIRYISSLKTTLRPWHHILCLIALMWVILGIDSRAFWLWWTRSCGMTLHWGITTLESFYQVCNHFASYITLGHTFFFFIKDRLFRWPLCRGILFLVDCGFLSHGHSSEEIRCHFSHWSMRHDWYISFGVPYIGAYLSQSMVVL